MQRTRQFVDQYDIAITGFGLGFTLMMSAITVLYILPH